MAQITNSLQGQSQENPESVFKEMNFIMKLISVLYWQHQACSGTYLFMGNEDTV